jgi:CHAD domain-containing protein
MSKYSNNKPVSPEVAEEAAKIARGIQQPGQTREQTRLVARGIRKGIEQYKKQQSSKTRELDKKIKQVSRQQALGDSQQQTAIPADLDVTRNSGNSTWLPWALLVITWAGLAVYAVL